MKKGWVVAGIVVGLVALLVIGLLIAGGLAVAARGAYGPHMMVSRFGHPWGMGVDGGGHGVLLAGGLLVLLLFASVLGGSVLAATWYTSQRRKASGVTGGDLTALDILKKRYAGGEIDREEYERMREGLLK